VDVFFLVSGFLITGQLARAAARGGLDLPARWSRMVRRLLPSATVVLLGTILAASVLLPETRWPQTVREIIASALFVENWQLAADAVDYNARNNTTSVVQHFWSLSIQVQFFLLWPLLVSLVVLVARRAPERLHAHLTATLIGLFAASLSFSIVLTAADQPLAYFHSLTRLWEFALGGLLALWIDRVPWTRGERVMSGWAGVLGLVACGFVLDGGSVFPGYAALWPTACAALVLVGGVTRSRYGAHRLLVLRPVQFLGSVSYPLYLWHWPVLVLFMVARDQDEVGPLGALAVISMSLALAALTSRFVESPVRSLRFGVGSAYGYGAAAVTTVLLATAIWQFAADQRALPTDGLGGPQYPGAAALVDGEPGPAPLLPAPVSVYEDWVWVDHWDCTPLEAVPSSRSRSSTTGSSSPHCAVRARSRRCPRWTRTTPSASPGTPRSPTRSPSYDRTPSSPSPRGTCAAVSPSRRRPGSSSSGGACTTSTSRCWPSGTTRGSPTTCRTASADTAGTTIRAGWIATPSTRPTRRTRSWTCRRT
jgi:peptidoglycan/LPS O-acetylase OafA/YrhL